MGRRLEPLGLDDLGELPEPFRSCVFWELDPVAAEKVVRSGDPALEKEAWVSATQLAWGTCGTVVRVDDAVAGFALYAPPAYVPRATGFPTAPVGRDAVLLTGLRVLPGQEGGGLGRMLVQGTVRDLARRGVRALEAYGDAGAADGCVLPVDFLLAVGFTTVRPHPRWPRLRLDVRGALAWWDEAEAALERLLAAGTGITAPAPSPA